MAEQYDVVVIGAGVAGLTAGMFAARYGLRTVVLEQMMSGGQIINAERIENYPGLTEPVAGFDLGPRLQEQADNAGAEFMMGEATGLKLEGGYRVVESTEGPLRAKSVIIAAGSTLRKLGLPKEEELHGAGVSYCASCDGGFFTDQVVGVVGGGDSALDEAITLTSYASKVIMLNRGDRFVAQKVLIDEALRSPKIEVRWNTEVTEILGDGGVEGVSIRDTGSGETSRLDLSGLFIFVGLDPNTAWLKETLPLDNAGHIPVDLWMQTPVEGILAAGDIRRQSAALLASSAGDGATAARAAWRYVTGRDWS